MVSADIGATSLLMTENSLVVATHVYQVTLLGDNCRRGKADETPEEKKNSRLRQAPTQVTDR